MRRGRVVHPVADLLSAAARVRRDLPLAGLDAVLVTVAYVTVLVLRFDGHVPERYWGALLMFAPVLVFAHVGAHGITGLYGKLWQQAGVQEARSVLTAGALSGLVLLAALLPGERELPLSVIVLGSLVAALLTGGVRFQSRLFAFRRQREAASEPDRVVVIGAGNAAGAAVREMLADRAPRLCPVAVIDERPDSRGRTLSSVPIIGGLEALADAVVLYGAEQALLAMPEADNEQVASIAEAVQAAGLKLKVLPGLAGVMNGVASVRDVRDLSIADLLGRQQVTTDLDAVRHLLAKRRVLITGAGGSIGSEIARQVARFDPAELYLLDHDETHLHDAAGELARASVQVLADIRDMTRLQRVFDTYQPEVVFHAAAHKHVPVLESHPIEAVRTNVFGTENVLRAAVRADVENFVLISTDKAVNPSSVMGATKRLAEQLLLHRRPAGRAWCVVRFGNVLGSRGSVVPLFVRQIRRGGPVTVTDPEVTRYFMSTEEAVQLVLQACALATGSEVFMLDMGEPIRIVDLAERMIALTGRVPYVDVPIEFTGLRPGEKLYEELRAADEPTALTVHPAINRVLPVMAERAHLEVGLERLTVWALLQDNQATARTLFDLSSATPASQVFPVLNGKNGHGHPEANLAAEGDLNQLSQG